MAPFLKAFIVLLAIAALADVAVCENYTVGAPNGSWDLNTNYEEWVKDLNFYAGDFLIFRYTSFHDVAEVTKDVYTSCSSSQTISIDKSGTTIFELKEAGTRYFICAVPTHCSGGMKVQIDVLPKLGTPVSKPNLAPSLPPASPPHVFPPHVSPTPAPAPSPSAAAVTPQGVGMFAYSVLGLIGLMLAVL
ncbi:Early nodulin-like protein 1 [Rhynchospora pubera]|uniref:Early nodulin-like protein 1 n=1 Tax=Rhynchospora pubera TaxID=906938 RepID=A0AAV8FKX0_9POAL|nr:Early nodulin-like protein 1 [Rhynchospora pubera]